MIIHRCTVCKKEFAGHDELAAELAFDQHECLIDYSKLTTAQLWDLAHGKITPEELLT
jgi:hypothetical protein